MGPTVPTCERSMTPQLIAAARQLLPLSLLLALLLLPLPIPVKPQLLSSPDQQYLSNKQQQQQQQQQTPAQSSRQKKEATSNSSISQYDHLLNVQEADEQGLYLLGLFDLHQASPRAPLKCGPIDLDAGEWRSRRSMQNMEAFLWAIEQVNADKSLLPGVKLGSLVLDTCSSFLRTNQQLANLLHGNAGDQPAQVRQLAAVVADQADWQSVEATASMASALGLTTFVSQSRSSRLAELARRYRAPVAAQLVEQLSQQLSAAAAPLPPVGLSLDFGQELVRRSNAAASATGSPARRLESLLGELLGVGKLPGDAMEALTAASSQSAAVNESLLLVPAPAADEHERLLMVRMRLGTELVAEAIAALLQRMSWDLISIVHDDEEADMVELHEELARQLMARNMQLALDEQVNMSMSAELYDSLLRRLAAKTVLGSRVVVSLVSSGSARNLLAGLRRLRSSLTDSAQVSQLNAMLWISVADREPYYAYAVDALGTLVISGASSLMADFRSHYERLSGGSRNKWWPEYLRGILSRQQRELEPLSKECTRWQEPSLSPLPERCAALSLSGLYQAELQAAAAAVTNKSAAAAITSKQQMAAGQTGRLAKYLAGGWEHNGMDVINAVLSAANGLESVRQALCPEGTPGLCPRMRELLAHEQVVAAAGVPALPTVSELMYNELLRSTFQLADGRMFNLDDFAGPGGGQVEGKLKLYSLRYLQPNSIGFVRFGSYDQQDGLALNASKALHYPLGANPLQQEPIERLRSTCEDESRCLSAEAMNGAVGSANPKAAAISEEELALGVNSLFKLDHPLILSKPSSSEQQQPTPGEKQQQELGAQVVEEDAQESHTMRSQLGHQFAAGLANLSQHQHRTSQVFNVIVLLPLHLAPIAANNQQVHRREQQQQHCAKQPMETERAFQQLAALAFAQGVANQQAAVEEQQIELTTTVIDYCERQELARSRLAWRLSARSSAGKPVAVIDFDAEVSKNIDSLADEADLLHLTIGAAAAATADVSTAASKNSASSKHNHHQHLRVSLLPGKTDELQALVKLIQSMANWRLVHLIYTDKQHQLRDEFVRRANEANICVSKLIWIPTAIECNNGNSNNNNNNNATCDQQQQAAAGRQLDKTRHLFLSELHDFGNSSAGKAHSASTSAEGLNATRLLVVLASSHAPTNRLLLEAASRSMLDDYVWLTTHEWLNSIERPATRDLRADLADPTQIPAAHSARRLPRLLLSTRLESADAHEFGQFLENLTPAAHAPLPTSWFDEFWQQHFRCHLPIGPRPPFSSLEPAPATPTCKPSQRLEARELWQDERVHYTIRAIEALHVALSAQNGSQVSGHELATNFRSAYDRSRQLEAPGSALARLPYGFHIVHRVLAPEPPAATSASGKSVRRDNSRNLANATSEPEGELMRVGVWRSGELVLARHQNRPTWIGAGEPSDAETASAISRSLNRLAAIKSRCTTEATCGACRAQIGQTNALIRQEEARLRQIQAAEPSVVSSIRAAHSSGMPTTMPPSSLDLAQPEATFDEDTENPGAATTQRPAAANPKGSQARETEDIQAAASSLIGQRSAEEQRLDDIRAAYFRLRQAGWASASGQPPFTLNLRQTSGALMSGLSLIGVVGVVLSMAYLYPSAASKSLDMTGEPRDVTSSSLRQLDNINDYFLLTGLLMLYSINMAFLLPATTGVCWFRRVGLPASYSVILSAILVRVLAACRRSSGSGGHQQPVEQSANSQPQPPQQQPQQQVDSSEESVEVTFESLPVESALSEQPPAGDQLTNGYQTTTNGRQPQQHQVQNNEVNCSSSSTCNSLVRPTTLMALQVALVLSQLLASLIWLARQPPEPTLYLGCWRCASPSRSPMLFLYEPLLSLLYSALMLTCAWCLSIRNFRCATRADDQFRTATRRLLSPSVCQSDFHLTGKRQQLKQRLRDSKALLMSCTLLVLVWSLTTLHMISTSNRLLPSSQTGSNTAANQHQQQQSAVYSVMSTSESVKSDDLSLVYANIVSGAIVFVFLFVYRLRLVNRAAICCPPLVAPHYFRSKSRTFSTGTLAGSSAGQQSGAQQRVLKFNQALEPSAGTKWLDECTYPAVYGSGSFSGSQFSAPDHQSGGGGQHQERLRLQQFNSYGTYATTAAGAAAPQTSSHHHNPLSFQAIASTFTSRKTGGSTAQGGSQETPSGKLSFSGAKKRSRASPGSLFFGSGSSPATKRAAAAAGGTGSAQLQRRQSAGSVASSTAKLVRDNNWMLDEHDDDLEDTISCASSVASSSTSQLHGNDLYPINCSIQLDMQLANSSSTGATQHQPPTTTDGGATSTLNRSGSFRRSSLRRSVSSKLNTVREEHRT